MPVKGVKIRILVICVSACMVVLITSTIFHLTQDFFKTFHLGKRLFDADRYEEALPYWERASRLKPQDPETTYYLIWTYDKLGKREQSLELLKGLWQKNPATYELTRQLADAYYGSKEYSKAEELYRRLMERRPDDEIDGKLTEVLVWQKKYAAALPLLEAKLLRFPDDPKWMKLTADVNAWTGNYERAISLYRKILSTPHGTPDLVLKIAETYRFAGNNEEALKIYDEYLKKSK